MDKYPRYLSKKKQIIHYFLMASILFLACFQTAHSVKGGGKNFYIDFGVYQAYYGQLMPILIPGLLGYIPGMIFTIIMYIYSMVTTLEYSYYNSAFLMIVIVTYYCAKNKLLHSKRGFVLAFLVISFLEGPLWQIMTSLVTINGKFYPQYIFYSWLTVLPETFLGLLFLRLFYTKMSDSVKELFFTPHFFTKYHEDNYGDSTKPYHSKLANRVNFIFVTGLIALATAQVAIIVLIYNYYVSGITLRFLTSKEQISFLIRVFLMSINLFVPGMSIFDYALKKTVVNPLQAIAGFMTDYSAAGDKDRNALVKNISIIKPFHKDEIMDLYKAFESLINDINNYIAHIKEEKRLKDDLRVAQAASEAKSAFLSRMSHEIRTPINAVLGMDEMIIRETKEKDTLKYAKDIQSAGKILLALINDILDFSKIEANKMEIQPIEYNLSSFVNDLYSMVSKAAREKKLKFEIKVPSEMPSELFGDEIRLKQCIINLLNNSIKYTDTGHVYLEITGIPQSGKIINMHVKVEDTGSGIKEEDLEKLYMPFERMDKEKNKFVEGTGLGMNIVQRLLELMDSSLVIKSQYGVGSTFEFDILQKVIDWTPVGDIDNRINKVATDVPAYKEMLHAPDAKILVVDDTEMNLTVVKELLKQTQAVIDTATSGYEALEKVTKEKYDLIFIDHRMPKMDGVETLSRMNELENNKSAAAPCVALTANAISGARRQYIAYGFADYLAKPVNGTDLEKTLIRLLPAEKVHLVKKDEEAEEIPRTDSFKDRVIKYGDAVIDYRAALENCSSEDILKKVMGDFLVSIDQKSDLIQKYLRDHNLSDYTVMVHALKSSSRLIGALKLSELAALLESDGDSQNVEELEKLTPDLIEQYRDLKPILERILSDNESEETEEKAEIEGEQLYEALKSLYEFVDAFDFDSADAVIKMLDDYRMPADFVIKYKNIKELITAVDRERLMEALSQYSH
ncbi:MAG: response regulator [Butyrivibrio sp.]|nr:response regulator [Butyrivibrio sp.]